MNRGWVGVFGDSGVDAFDCLLGGIVRAVGGSWGVVGCWPPVGVTAPDYSLGMGWVVEMVVFFVGWGSVGSGEDVV